MGNDNEHSILFKFLILLVLLVTILVVVGLFITGYSLIIWGIGNAIIWLFKLGGTWTFLQSFVLALIFEGITLIIKWIF